MDTNTNQHGVPHVVFQSIIGAGDGCAKGCEALGRKRTPSDVLLLPAVFMWDMDSNSRVEFDYVIAELAIRAFATRRWACLDFWMSINSSKATLQDFGYAPYLIHLAHTYGIECRQVMIEMLEECTLFFNDSRIMHTVDMLAHAGFIVVVDDYPNGDHPDALLRWLFSRNAHDRVIGGMKLDKSFIKTVAAGGHIEEARDLIHTAHDSGMFVVAEGIETSKQAGDLIALGADYLQGYLYGMPCNKEECFAHA